MSCEVIKFPDGGSAIICRRGAKPPGCQVPGCDRPGTQLCDFPVVRQHKAGTCDMRLCQGHAKPFKRDADLCPAHAKVMAEIKA